MLLYYPNSSTSLNKQKENFSKNMNSPSPHNLLTLPQQNKNKNVQNKYTSNLNLTPSNKNKSNKYNIHEKLEQYKINPASRLNLKLIGEDIKQKLIEMNEKNDFIENEKTISSPTESKKYTKIIREKYNISNDDTIMNLNLNRIRDEKNEKLNNTNIVEKPQFDFFNHNNDIKENEKNTPCTHIINIKIPKITNIEEENNNKNKNNEKEKKNLKRINSSKYRKIKKRKILYDSMEDNESEEEIEGEVINPETKFILIFDLLIILFYIYNFFVITINILKTECFCSSNNINFSDILFYFSDLLYISDLIISFFRCYYNFEYKIIKSNRLIIKNYLLGDFFLDLFEAIPFFSISKYICLNNKNYYNCYSYEIPSILFFLKISSFFKILKIIKILGRKKNQALDNFFELISENYTIERTALLMVDSLIFIGIFHCFVCLHIFIGKHSYSNWILKTNSDNESFFNIYIESLYFLITTLTTVGYGDITCNSFGETIFHILLLAVGSIFYSYIISTIGNYIKNDSHAKIKYNNDLNILEKIRITYPNMPFKLYKNIHKYLESKSSSQEKYDVNSLIDTLPFTLKNTILFTMYKSVIKNFKFFKKNDNSEFIAQVLINFIPVFSKRNEFLIYEGEIVEEIIFIKDGRISMNAAINLEDPSFSINKYFNEKFSPFTSDEEKKLLGSFLNDNNVSRSIYVSGMNGEITYDTAKTKINNAFKTLKNKSTNEKSAFTLNNNMDKNKINDFSKFDVNGGVIKNEDGSYQYLKIIDIRKNEHFGCVFMTLKKPCPLTLQVKSKFAELYLFKKEEAVSTSKSYPNIWKKLYGKEFHNLRAIKDMTFKALRKYIEVNQLLLDLHLDDAIAKNDLTVNDLNELEKSIYTEKSNIMNPLVHSRKSISNNITKFKTMNSEIDKKQKRLSLGRIYVQNHKDKFPALKKKFKGGNLYSNSIIYTNKDKILKLESIGSNNPSILNQTNKRIKTAKVVHFANDIIITKSSKDVMMNKENISIKKKISSSEILSNDENESEIKSNINKSRAKYQRIKKLKKFLIKCKKKLKIRQCEENEYKNNFLKEKKNDIVGPNFQMKKGILKDKTNKNQIISIKKDEQINPKLDKNDKIENSNNKLMEKTNNNEDSLIKDLKNFCNEENNFSFLNNLSFEDLSINNNINLEILSSYENLNQLSKGKYISDYHAQNKIKLKIKKYFIRKSNDDYTLSLKSLELSQDSKRNIKLYKNKKKNTIKSSDKHKHEKNRKIKYSKKKVKNNSKSHKTIRKIIQTKIYQKERKKDYETEIQINNNQNKVSSSMENESINKKGIKNGTIHFSNNDNNFTFYSGSISGQNSIKANISSNAIDNNNSSSISKNIGKIISQNDSIEININKNKNVYNKSEVEFEVNKSYSKTKYKSNSINNINNNNIYRNNNHKKKNENNKSKKNNNKERKIINKILGMQFPRTNIITNNITTNSSNHNDNKNNFNTNEKINNIEASFSIYNIIQKNVNKNLNIIDSKDKIGQNNLNKSFCFIY